MIKLLDILTEINQIKSIKYYEQLLKNVNVSPSTYKLFQNTINAVKRKNGEATNNQLAILKRIETGNFNPSTKN
jgi:hypothetical protein